VRADTGLSAGIVDRRDGNLSNCAIVNGPGTLSSGNWCYTPSGDETVNVTIRCTDACGAYCEESFSVTFSMNDAPACVSVSDTTYFQCAPTEVCRPVSATDVNGNFASCAVLTGPGTVLGGNCVTRHRRRDGQRDDSLQRRLRCLL